MTFNPRNSYAIGGWIDGKEVSGIESSRIRGTAHYVSYGFNIHFVKFLYSSLSFGIGAEREMDNYVWTNEEGKVLRDYNNNYLRLGSLFKIGLGFNIPVVKRRDEIDEIFYE